MTAFPSQCYCCARPTHTTELGARWIGIGAETETKGTGRGDVSATTAAEAAAAAGARGEESEAHLTTITRTIEATTAATAAAGRRGCPPTAMRTRIETPRQSAGKIGAAEGTAGRGTGTGEGKEGTGAGTREEDKGDGSTGAFRTHALSNPGGGLGALPCLCYGGQRAVVVRALQRNPHTAPQDQETERESDKNQRERQREHIISCLDGSLSLSLSLSLLSLSLCCREMDGEIATHSFDVGPRRRSNAAGIVVSIVCMYVNQIRGRRPRRRRKLVWGRRPWR